MSVPVAQPGEESRQHYGLTLAVLVVAALSFALSQTLVAPALPEIQRELGTSTTAVTFVLTAYLLAASVATPVLGRLGDMFGKERVLVITLVVFAAGSLVAALSRSIRGPDRRPRDPGGRRGGVPALVRHHPRRVPGASASRPGSD